MEKTLPAEMLTWVYLEADPRDVPALAGVSRTFRDIHERNLPHHAQGLFPHLQPLAKELSPEEWKRCSKVFYSALREGTQKPDQWKFTLHKHLITPLALPIWGVMMFETGSLVQGTIFLLQQNISAAKVLFKLAAIGLPPSLLACGVGVRLMIWNDKYSNLANGPEVADFWKERKVEYPEGLKRLLYHKVLTPMEYAHARLILEVKKMWDGEGGAPTYQQFCAKMRGWQVPQPLDTEWDRKLTLLAAINAYKEPHPAQD